MKRCRECGSPQPDGALFCGECGYDLLRGTTGTTAVLPFSDELIPSRPPTLPEPAIAASGKLNIVVFVIPSSGRKVTLEATEQIRVGRKDLTKGVEPELDLTIDGGGKYGVSREHAVIQFTPRGAALVDLGSTNGTLLNNYRLPPNLPYLLRNGDEVRFGHLLAHVFLEVRDDETPQARRG